MARQAWSVLAWVLAIPMTMLIFALGLSWLLLVRDPSLFWGDEAFWHTNGPSRAELERMEIRRSELLDHTLNSTLGFAKIYVISMPDKLDKRRALSEVAEASNIQFEFVDGVRPEDVDLETLPPDADGSPHGLMRGYALGAWKAHMNTIDRIIADGHATAVIAEDDIDWDVRIKPQLRSSARAFQTLTQPFLYRSDRLKPEDDNEIDFDHLPPVQPPTSSPYGDHWDVLWLGLCRQAVGRHLPHVIRKDDVSVPPKHLIRVSDIDKPWTLLEDFPEHTRIYHQMREGLCSLFYAVTLEAAKKIKYEFGERMMSGPLDVMLLQYCNPEGRPSFGDKQRLRCYSPMPQIFNHWDAGRGNTHDVRYSARINVDELRARNGIVAEDNQDQVWVDSWPDDHDDVMNS